MLSSLRSIKSWFHWKLFLLNGKYNADKWYFILLYGIGDAYMVSALLNEFLKIHDEEVILIFNKKSQIFIPKLFLKNIEIRFEENIPLYLSDRFSSTLRKGTPIILHPFHLYNKILLSVIGFNKLTLLDVYRILLNLDSRCTVSIPDFLPLENRENVARLFQNEKLVENKTVLVCPQANSIELLSPDFWINLADTINKIGFLPVFMNFSDPEGRYKSVSFPLEDSVEFCNRAGYVISLRSGFCDLISSSKAKKIILYTDTNYYSGKLIDSTSIVEMALANATNTFEFVLTMENKFQTVNQIIELIHE